MVSYKRLWKTLLDKDMTKTDLRMRVGMSTATLARMGRDEYVEMKLLDKICNELQCGIEDVFEVIIDKKEGA